MQLNTKLHVQAKSTMAVFNNKSKQRLIKLRQQHTKLHVQAKSAMAVFEYQSKQRLKNTGNKMNNDKKSE